MRTVLVVVPDDDSCEKTIRYAAQQMREGNELIVLDYDPVIPKTKVPAVVAQLVAFLRVKEAAFRQIEADLKASN